MLCSAATKDCRLIRGINPDFLFLIHLEIFLKEFHLNTCTEIEKLFPGDSKVKASLTSGGGHNLWHNSDADLCVKTVAYEFHNTGGITAELHGGGSKDRQLSELQFIHNRSWCGKIRFKTQVTACSDFPSDAMLWIKEVEMVDSLDDLKSSRSVCGKDFQDFELLDAKMSSALNKITQNSQFKKKVSLEEQKAQREDRFPRARQIAFMIFDYFRVTGVHDTVLDFADLFSASLHDNNIQEFDKRWYENFYYL